MRVKVLRQFLNGRTVVHEGETIDVTEQRAAALERHVPPLVVREVGSLSAPERQPQPLVGEGASAGGQDPTSSPPTGGQTGGGRPASSSRAARRPAKRASSGRGEKRGSSR